MRYAIYARYSSDNQNERSIQDQIRICSDFIRKQNGQLIKIYSDHAISGSHLKSRPEMLSLMKDANNGDFDIVLSEGLDRLSRDQEDIASIYKRLKYHQVEIITLSEGQINEMHIGLKGTMNALFLVDLANKTRRGQTGAVKAGKVPGGLCYGYEKVVEFDNKGEPIRGKRKINKNEAETIRYIFEEYASGRSTVQIVKELNQKSVKSPKGKGWAVNTLMGNVKRGTGILNNELYNGRIVFNRQRFTKNPITGKREARPNPKDEWVIQEVPELRIITDELWQKVKQVKRKFSSNRVSQNKRPTRLLSGLLRCGCCGGTYTISHRDKYGCSTAKQKGMCQNRLLIGVKEVENRVLEGLKNHISNPVGLNDFIEEFHQRQKQELRDQAIAQGELNKQLKKVEVDIQKAIRAIMDGALSESLKDHLNGLEIEKIKIKQELSALGKPEPIRVLPNFGQIYSEKISKLRDSLNDVVERQKAVELLRSMIDRIVLIPNKNGDPLNIEIHGQLASIMHFTNGDVEELEKCMLPMVAGAHNHWWRHMVKKLNIDATSERE